MLLGKTARTVCCFLDQGDKEKGKGNKTCAVDVKLEGLANERWVMVTSC